MSYKRIAAVLFYSLIFLQILFAQNSGFRGKVIDYKGLPIFGAKIELISNSGNVSRCESDENGDFVCVSSLEGSYRLEIRADGFSILRQNVEQSQTNFDKQVFTLSPETLRAEVVVSANRIETRIGETPASVVTLSKREIETTAASVIDDVLRQVPGFTLFRRAGSRTANPTTQGVSLRGTGASGAGRSLVLFDFVPLNDPFGGWVQWNRIPTIAVENIEVVRGAATSLYGDSLSGTVNIFPRNINEKYVFSAETFGGTQKTFSASTFTGFRQKDWSADLTATGFQTRGYKDIEEINRGLADDFSGTRNVNFSGRIAKDFGDSANIFFKTSYFGEARNNGTIIQKNKTHLRQLVFGGNAEVSSFRFQVPSFNVTWRVFGGTQVFDQTFSAVAGDRNSENLVRIQRVPAQNFGINALVSGVLFKNQTIVFGVDAQEVRGSSDEAGFFNSRQTSVSGAGGRERSFGIFLQDYARIGSKIIIAGSVRFDRWKNFRAFSAVRTLSNNLTNVTVFPERSEDAFSPQISFLYQATNEFSFHTVYSKSFRAPTLNELYRGFRVGDIVTNPNQNLRAEKADNFEAGASFVKNNFYLRGNFFYTQIEDPIANITTNISPNLITRQRQNAGETRAAGFEIEAEKRFRDFGFSVGYLFTDSRVTRFPANPVLENLRVPQVARQQFTFQSNYTRNTWNFALQGRANGKQFDDDLNLFRLEPFFQLDGFVSRRFGEKFKVFVGIENIFNSRYSTGRTPLRTISAPTNVRIGLRWN